ncbi:MAG TPA: YraN family protein [Rhizomicrobium sp.]|nr:YraN family protein [Rhizomicrobium sp.]
MATDRQKKYQVAHQRGHRSEALAALWLRLKGYRILARRLKTKAGEIDLVAAAPFGPICFIEVKARKLALAAAQSVLPAQQTRIARAASLYLAGRPGLARRGARFDIVAIGEGRWPRHHRDVWRADI